MRSFWIFRASSSRSLGNLSLLGGPLLSPLHSRWKVFRQSLAKLISNAPNRGSNFFPSTSDSFWRSLNLFLGSFPLKSLKISWVFSPKIGHSRQCSIFSTLSDSSKCSSSQKKWNFLADLTVAGFSMISRHSLQNIKQFAFNYFTANLPSVSKPNITRLNDESVMVKWSVVPSSTDGSLPIQFFKVQYMMVPSDSQKHKGQKSNEDWITLNEDIPPHLRSYEIHHLKLDHHYKFRISAVYSNNDNKQSPIRRFHLKRVKQSIKAALPVPNDIQISPVSEMEVTVRWSIPEPYQHHFGGFYISYRPTTSADEYSIVSAEGPHKRHILIKHLEPGMNYEFKIQSFSSITASEFSAIVMGRTLSKSCNIIHNFICFNSLLFPSEPTSPPTTTHPTIKPVKDDSKGQSSFLPLIVGAIGACALLFLIFLLIFIALKRRRDMVNTQREGRNETFWFSINIPLKSFHPNFRARK